MLLLIKRFLSRKGFEVIEMGDLDYLRRSRTYAVQMESLYDRFCDANPSLMDEVRMTFRAMVKAYGKDEMPEHMKISRVKVATDRFEQEIGKLIEAQGIKWREYRHEIEELRMENEGLRSAHKRIGERIAERLMGIDKEVYG